MARFEPAEGFYPLAALAKHRDASESSGKSSTSATPTQPLTLPLAIDPDLARVVEAWATLPVAIRRAMLALIGSTDVQPMPM
jgi:hypothetical protein